MKTTLLLLMLASASALANNLPTVINTEQHSEIGTVSVSSVPGTMDDAIHKMQKEAQDLGGKTLYITSLSTPGHSSFWQGTAEVYR
ncbi:DUF1471 domain-containing protein [Enterobacter sp. 22466]|uniref:DUF1471 domain-containing protein n=1 Tax=Enterobacter sp. 22466 TaxID=3453924 RepID=UPI003F831179